MQTFVCGVGVICGVFSGLNLFSASVLWGTPLGLFRWQVPCVLSVQGCFVAGNEEVFEVC